LYKRIVLSNYKAAWPPVPTLLAVEGNNRPALLADRKRAASSLFNYQN